MPKRYRAESYRPAPNWLSIWKSMYLPLEPNAVSILQPTGFYERNDLDIPTAGERRRLDGEERAAIERIATALTIAAYCSHDAPRGIVAAWLQRIARKPTLFRSKELPPEVHWDIVSNYSRDTEKPGTHLQDVWGRRRVCFKVKARRPTDTNIANAAQRALKNLPRRRGRPRNAANWLLAQYLTRAFQSFGGRVVRSQIPIDVKGGGVLYVDSGPFYSFLDQVIGPLRTHLNHYGLPRVTIETIERIATENFV